METLFEEAEKLFYDSIYEESFVAFEKIAKDSNCEESLRAEAYNMMGVIISGPAPYLSKDEDESGLEYFKAALKLDDKNLGAALNILEGYQTSPTGHSDRESVELACNLLKKGCWDELSEEDKTLVINTQKKLPIEHQLEFLD